MTETECLFNSDMPELPYIRPTDLMDNIYTIRSTCVRGDDGRYTDK